MIDDTRRLRRLKYKGRVEEIKRTRGCARCKNQDPRVLEFHHVRGGKLFNISQGENAGWVRNIEEIAKCEVLCANCHIIAEWEKRQ